jgi:hypothetical protein
MISEGGEDKGLVEARDDGGFEYAFSGALVIFGGPCRITRQEDMKVIRLSLVSSSLDVV